MFNFEMFVLFVFVLFVLVWFLFVKYICIMFGVDRVYDFRYSGNIYRKLIGIFVINLGKFGDV